MNIHWIHLLFNAHKRKSVKSSLLDERCEVTSKKGDNSADSVACADHVENIKDRTSGKSKDS